MKKPFKKYNYTWLDLIVDICLAFLIGLVAIAGVCLLCCIATAILPIGIILLIGWVILLIFKAINKK